MLNARKCVVKNCLVAQWYCEDGALGSYESELILSESNETEINVGLYSSLNVWVFKDRDPS